MSFIVNAAKKGINFVLKSSQNKPRAVTLSLFEGLDTPFAKKMAQALETQVPYRFGVTVPIKAEAKTAAKVVKTEYEIQRQMQDEIAGIFERRVKSNPEYQALWGKKKSRIKNIESWDAEDVAYLEKRTIRRFIEDAPESVTLSSEEEKLIDQFNEKYVSYTPYDIEGPLEKYIAISENMESIRSQVVGDIVWAIKTSLGNNGLSQHEDEILRLFKERVFSKLSNQQLGDIKDMICKSNCNGEDLLRFLKSDFAEVVSRDVEELLPYLGFDPKTAKGLRVAYDKLEEFKYCTSEDFERLRTHLLARHEVINQAGNNWKTVLKMNDDDYKLYLQLKDSIPQEYEILDIQKLAIFINLTVTILVFFFNL